MNRLKVAEKDASKKVSEARQYRVDKMRDAKVGAERAISAYKDELEAAYQSQVMAHSGSNGTSGSELSSSTDAEISELGRCFSSNKEVTEKMLVDLVTAVNP
jgi:V-type H+-transporting ATPase subunit G